MTDTSVDNLYGQFLEIKQYLTDNSQVSFALTIENNAKKILLLSAASYFEIMLLDTIIFLFQKYTDSKEAVLSLIKNKAFSRQYHTLFDWNSSNANTFFSLFGDDFKTYMQDIIKNDPKLNDSIKAFIEIGSERNRLVHMNFGTYYLEKTDDEIYDLYRKSCDFVLEFNKYLKHYIEK